MGGRKGREGRRFHVSEHTQVEILIEGPSNGLGESES